MKPDQFYLGAHHPNWLATAGVPLFISRRRLHERKTFPRAVAPWALDSGGFTELNTTGRWSLNAAQYATEVERYRDEIGMLEWVAPQDWMCEPFVLAKTNMAVVEHQVLTVRNFQRLRDLLGPLVMPVLQGWTLDDYLRCVEAYERHGIDLAAEAIVGVGSVCRRQDTLEAEAIFQRLANEGLQLHGFGIKIDGFDRYHEVLASADSMAWSFAGRFGGEGEDTMPLFAWPKRMLCGLLHPSEHPAKACNNCLPWARIWRSQVLDRLESPCLATT